MYVLKGNARAKIAVYRVALACIDKNAKLHFKLGSARAELGAWRDAITAYEAALARDDSPANWHFMRAIACEKLDRWDDASISYRNAVARDDSDPKWHWRLGAVRARLEDWSGATAAFEAAISRDPDDARWHYRLGSARAKLGDWSGASASYRAFLKADPENDSVRYKLAHSLSRCGDDKNALQIIKPCIDRNDSVLERFLSGNPANGFAGATPRAEVLFVSGANTVLARKVSLDSAAKEEKFYFEHSRWDREKCQRVIDFYENLGRASCKKFARLVPRLHHSSLEENFGYFLYDYVEGTAAGPGQVQENALADLRLGMRIVDALAELANSDFIAMEPPAGVSPHESSALKDIRPYITSQILLNNHDHSVVSGLETLADNWCDHYSRYEAFPKATVHGNLHDQNIAVSPDGQIRIFDWEGFGRAPVGYDVVMLFRDSWEHNQFEHFMNHYFDNISAEMPSEERTYIISMLVILISAWNRRPLPAKWLRHLNDF